MATEREQLIDKLADSMDRDNATAFVDRVIAEALLLRQRESHQKIFDLQGAMIDALREALAAVSRTQDEMARVFAADEETHDALEE